MKEMGDKEKRPQVRSILYLPDSWETFTHAEIMVQEEAGRRLVIVK